MRFGLESMERGLEQLGHPEHGLCCVQIAGTNGKGTTSAAVAHAARACGLRVGLYTSPHLHRFSERIHIDGREVEPDVLEPALREVLELGQSRHRPALTFFEAATLAATLVFKKQQVDLCVLEVGLGGRLDATSALPKVATAITSIGLDHTEILGTTIAQIAAEKAAIARPGVPLVVGPLPPDALSVVRRIAAERESPLRICGQDFHPFEDMGSHLLGQHMRENLAVAAQVLAELGRIGLPVELERVVASLASLRWPGRMEYLPGVPACLLDGAHNFEGTTALVRTLEQQRITPTCLLFGAVSGKPAAQMLSLLRRVSPACVLAPPPVPRVIECGSLAVAGDVVAPDIATGLAQARHIAGEQGLVLITGSLFTVAEARRLLLNEPSDPPIRL